MQSLATLSLQKTSIDPEADAVFGLISPSVCAQSPCPDTSTMFVTGHPRCPYITRLVSVVLWPLEFCHLCFCFLCCWSLYWLRGVNDFKCVFFSMANNCTGCGSWLLYLLTYLSNSSPVGHTGTTTFFHRVLFLAVAWALPHESPIYCSSVITVFHHIVFDHPGFLLPCGTRLRATMGMLSLGILSDYYTLLTILNI